MDVSSLSKAKALAAAFYLNCSLSNTFDMRVLRSLLYLTAATAQLHPTDVVAVSTSQSRRCPDGAGIGALSYLEMWGWKACIPLSGQVDRKALTTWLLSLIDEGLSREQSEIYIRLSHKSGESFQLEQNWRLNIIAHWRGSEWQWKKPECSYLKSHNEIQSTMFNLPFLLIPQEKPKWMCLFCQHLGSL